MIDEKITDRFNGSVMELNTELSDTGFFIEHSFGQLYEDAENYYLVCEIGLLTTPLVWRSEEEE